MNTRRIILFILSLTAAAVSIITLFGQINVRAQDTAPAEQVALTNQSSGFTYQGKLELDGSAVTDTCDFLFSLWDNSSRNEGQVGTYNTNNNVRVKEGHFAVVLNESGEFGTNPFNGAARWLQIEVDCPTDGGGLTLLGPRQLLYGTPYAHSLRPGAVISGNVQSQAALTLRNSGLLGDSLSLESTDGSGIAIEAGADGVYVASAGNPSTSLDSNQNNGIEVAGAEGVGLFIGRADDTGVNVNASGGRGIQVGTALSDGVNVNIAGGSGVKVFAAGDDGLHIANAGNPSATLDSNFSNGVEVAGAEGFGVMVGHADLSGVQVSSTNDVGVQVGSSASDGFRVFSAGGSGINVLSADSYGGFFNSATVGVYARGGNGNAADLVLGGNGSSDTADNGRIASDPAYASSDIFLESNDAVVVKLNSDNSDEDSDFAVWDPTGTTIFNVDNGGLTSVEVLEIKGGADFAEQFDITPTKASPEPGMLLCIDAANPGKLVVCEQAYDAKVAGVISGAGGIQPGMVMGQEGSVADGQYPVALSGRVYVWADATQMPIQPGDLLTSSSLAGHVMGVGETAVARGTVIGKAMSSLESGTGLVLLLVMPQ